MLLYHNLILDSGPNFRWQYTDLKSDITQLKTDLEKDIREAKTDLKDDIKEIRNTMRTMTNLVIACGIGILGVIVTLNSEYNFEIINTGD